MWVAVFPVRITTKDNGKQSILFNLYLFSSCSTRLCASCGCLKRCTHSWPDARHGCFLILAARKLERQKLKKNFESSPTSCSFSSIYLLSLRPFVLRAPTIGSEDVAPRTGTLVTQVIKLGSILFLKWRRKKNWMVQFK